MGKSQRSDGASHSYLVCTFQFGHCERAWTTACSAAEAIQQIWQSECLGTIKTDIISLGNYPSGVAKGFRHTFSDEESKQPNTLFIGAISREELKRQMIAANTAARKKEKDLQQRIEAIAHLRAKTVLIDELPERWRRMVRPTAKGCWLWKTAAKVAPYKDVYLGMKGTVPDGAWLLHSCDNRRCVNPNHLTLGSPSDNVRDMVARHRHRSQYGKRRKKL